MEVVSSEVTVQTGNEKMPAHLARPASGGPYPAIAVVMEAFGLNDQIKRITNQFASEGFVAIAPNLYFRTPNNVVPYSDLPGAFRLMGSINDEQVVKDMGATIAYLKTLKEAKSGAVGTTGFCMGGRVAFLAACRRHVDGDGWVIVQQHPPEWFSDATETEYTRDGVIYRLRDVSRPAPDLLTATVEYVVGDRCWTQTFTATRLDDARLDASLGAAGLRLLSNFIRWTREGQG